jgi:hypothetical protein
MTDHLTALPSEEADVLDLPEDWTDGARETFRAVFEERPDLSAAEVATLTHACALESAADRLDEVARAAGYVAAGSTGQVVAHPAAVESRRARTAASSILARLVGPSRGGGALTNSERGRAAARARWSR